ncbi:sugar kinase [Tepiditoga spiralis]|uniref:Sugar kinase n=1 Tax=Tepiditoga spiralis TaxID=2108365 RepID=A0A7G1G2T5_9BACT|nr:ROK family transcriptional regulator [Tepiditoga spiralis]BBE30700.1 sugar kinase [Tepiditoga spiralis]
MNKSFKSSELKILNKRKILKHIFLNKQVTRKELANITGLSNSSITRIITELILDNYIISTQKINESKYGRKSEVLSINKEKMSALIVDIDIKTTMLGYGRFDGSVEILKTIPTLNDFKKFKEYMIKFIKLFNYNFEYISFSIPGIVDSNNKKIINTPNLGWKNLFYKDIKLKNVLLDNDSNLSMLAEKTFSKDMKNIENAIFILVKEGIGAGLLINNNLYRGKNYGAGEIGHNIIFNKNKEIPLEKTVDFQNNYNNTLKILAQNISHSINLLNLEKVILGGKILNLQNESINKLKEMIIDFTFKNNKILDIRTTNFNYVPASMIGACSNAVLNFINKI